MRTLLIPIVVATMMAGLWPDPALANEGAAEVAVGGIQLRNERRVAMRKERLFISVDKVKVEYEFINESTEDVTTEIAFPIPEYGYSPALGRGYGFGDFKATIGGSRILVAREVRAFVGEREVTSELQSAGLEIESLAREGQFVPRVEPDGRQFEDRSLEQIPMLPRAQQERLRAHGIIGDGVHSEPSKPAWTVRILYHWVQHFPPGQLVRLGHTYRPATGDLNHIELPPDACTDAPFRTALEAAHHNAEGSHGSMRWVKYILTTANTWKTPIRDFELEVEYPEGEYVSLCWDGKLQRVGPRTFKSVLKDFVPRQELKVYFFRPAPRTPVESTQQR
jgi:Domain of unknown function (DUF4424)